MKRHITILSICATLAVGILTGCSSTEEVTTTTRTETTETAPVVGTTSTETRIVQ